jgi:tRNA(fMet)-specific endonuclease VapC
LRNGLRAKGRPIPDNDIWIAALGVQHGLTIATRDSHFRELDGVAILIW